MFRRKGSEILEKNKNRQALFYGNLVASCKALINNTSTVNQSKIDRHTAYIDRKNVANYGRKTNLYIRP